MNRLLRATDEHNHVRMLMATTTDLVREARDIHQTSPVSTAALGRLLTGAAMMGYMMKGDKDVLTLQIKGDGPIGGVLVTADSAARVKGYVNQPIVDIPLKANGKLDVSGAIGRGTLNVIKDLGLKDPYNGQIELVSGEIAEDLTYYFASSEQTPSVVALGVLVDVDYTVKHSGGFILQLMPDCSDEVIGIIENNLKDLPSVTRMMDQGMDEVAIVNRVMDGLNPIVRDEITPEYFCNCSKERVEKALITIGVKDLEELIEEGENIDMSCHFCNTHYEFSIQELEEMVSELKGNKS